MEVLSDMEFEKLIYENQAIINKVCNLYCNSRDEKDDLFQEITINIWKGLKGFKGSSKLSTWIYRVSLNTAISNLRRKKRNHLVYSDEMQKYDTVHETLESDDEIKIKALNEGIEKLKPIEKAIILLWLEEKSYDEISDIVGISPKNVSVKLVRLKRKLEESVSKMLTSNN